MQKKFTHGMIFLGIFSLSMANIFASQRFPDLMYRLITLNDQKAAHKFILGLADNKFEAQQSSYFETIFPSLSKKETPITLNVEEKIKEYQELLSQNNKNPLVLAHLAQLYYQKGDKSNGKKYYEEAKKIDPWIKVEKK